MGSGNRGGRERYTDGGSAYSSGRGRLSAVAEILELSVMAACDDAISLGLVGLLGLRGLPSSAILLSLLPILSGICESAGRKRGVVASTGGCCPMPWLLRRSRALADAVADVDWSSAVALSRLALGLTDALADSV